MFQEKFGYLFGVNLRSLHQIHSLQGVNFNPTVVEIKTFFQ